jgi:hypothetical protein
MLWTDDVDAFNAFPDGVVYGGPIRPSFAGPPHQLADGGLARRCQRLRHARPRRTAVTLRREKEDAIRRELCRADA